jgi:hypothetical protein
VARPGTHAGLSPAVDADLRASGIARFEIRPNGPAILFEALIRQGWLKLTPLA